MALEDKLNRVGERIAAEAGVMSSREVAEEIFKALFENGPNRLPASMKALAILTMGAVLERWKDKLNANNPDVTKWRDAYRDANMQAEELKLRFAMLEREGKL